MEEGSVLSAPTKNTRSEAQVSPKSLAEEVRVFPAHTPQAVMYSISDVPGFPIGKDEISHGIVLTLERLAAFLHTIYYTSYCCYITLLRLFEAYFFGVLFFKGGDM